MIDLIFERLNTIFLLGMVVMLFTFLIFTVRKNQSVEKAYFRAYDRITSFHAEIRELKELNKHLDIYTCFECDDVSCEYRWDHYNTRGDCLASK